MTRNQIITEIRKPGPVFIGMLIANDTTFIQAVKSDLIEWLSAQPENYDGIDCQRFDGILHIQNT